MKLFRINNNANARMDMQKLIMQAPKAGDKLPESFWQLDTNDEDGLLGTIYTDDTNGFWNLWGLFGK